MKQNIKREFYRFINLKLLWLIIFLSALLACIPLTDYSFYKSTVWDITFIDFIRLLDCGGGLFLGFSFNFILITSICIALSIYSEFRYRTFCYEKMSGISFLHSVVSRFTVASLIVIVEIIILVLAIAFFSIKNSFDAELGGVQIVLQFACTFVSGLHVAFATIIFAFIFQSGFKAVLASFVRYLILGFLWAIIAGQMDMNLRIQYLVLDPLNCVQTVFAGNLIMNNYWIMLSCALLSFIVDVLFLFVIAEMIDKKRDY